MVRGWIGRVKTTFVPAVAGLALCATTAANAQDEAAFVDPTVAEPTELPAGTYRLDQIHASLIFRVDHIGFSHFVSRFARFDATLEFDPAAPETMSVSATIDPASIETHPPDPDELDFNAILRSETWFDTATHPEMTFRSTGVTLTGETTADVTGDLTLRGVTHPVTLNVIFNGGYVSHPYDPNSRIGFSASGALLRSDFGMGFGVPPEGSRMGVSDEVEFLIEAEFLRPFEE